MPPLNDTLTGPDLQQHTTLQTNNPRQMRLLRALLQGPLTREQVDQTAGSSNGPDVISRLRRNMGLQIPCKMESVIDRDGRPIERGVYELSPQDQTQAQAALLALNQAKQKIP